MEKTLILFIEQTKYEEIKYFGKVGRISTRTKITPNSKNLSQFKIEDCALVYNVNDALMKRILLSVDRTKIIERAKEIYFDKKLFDGLLLQDSYANINNLDKQWLIEPSNKNP